MSDTLFFNPSKSAHMLIDSGMAQDDAFAHLVRLKDGPFAKRYDGTTYFDPRELQRIIKAARS